MKKRTDEKLLVTACLQNDIKAQERFYNLFAAKMMGVCWRFAKTREEAEDILQEGFFKVFCDLHAYKRKGALEGWVRKVIVNVALQHVRKKKMVFQSDFEIADLKLTDRSYEQLFQQFEVAELLKILHTLPEGCRTIFNLYVIEGFTHKEIAEKLNISVGTSKSQVSRARMLFQKQMEKKEVTI